MRLDERLDARLAAVRGDDLMPVHLQRVAQDFSRSSGSSSMMEDAIGTCRLAAAGLATALAGRRTANANHSYQRALAGLALDFEAGSVISGQRQ